MWNVVAQSEAQYNNNMGWFGRSTHETKEQAEQAGADLRKYYEEQARANTPAYGVTSNADRWEVAVVEAK